MNLQLHTACYVHGTGVILVGAAAGIAVGNARADQGKPRSSAVEHGAIRPQGDRPLIHLLLHHLPEEGVRKPDLVSHVAREQDGEVVVMGQPQVRPLLPQSQINIDEVVAPNVHILDVSRDANAHWLAGVRPGSDLVEGVAVQPHHPAEGMYFHSGIGDGVSITEADGRISKESECDPHSVAWQSDDGVTARIRIHILVFVAC